MGKRSSEDVRNKIIELSESIAATVDHAECFYDPKMLGDFLDELDELKRLSKIYYYDNVSSL